MNGYKKCDNSRLDQIADHLGFPTKTLFEVLEEEDTGKDQEFLRSILEAIDITATHTTDSAVSSIASDLREAFRDNTKTGFATETRLPKDAFEELAQLTSNYSSHRKTQTVTFLKERLVVDRKAAFPDSSKDTYLENGEVAKNYVALIEGITRYASIYKGNDAVFKIFAVLYNKLTSLSEDYCNQQNAADFATALQKFAPRHHRETSWEHRVSASESAGSAREH